MRDIPQQFNVSYYRAGNPSGLVYGSKGVGEPPLILAVSAVNALRQAVLSARAQSGNTTWMDIDVPLTPARVALACEVDLQKLAEGLKCEANPLSTGTGSSFSVSSVL